MSDELRECPKCGRKAYVEFDIGGGFKWLIVCDNCGLQSRLFDTEDQAITWWNARAYDARIAELEAALTEAHDVLLDVMNQATQSGGVGHYDTMRLSSYEAGAEYLERCGFWADDWTGDDPRGLGRCYHDVPQKEGNDEP